MARASAFWVGFGNLNLFKKSKLSVLVQGLSPSVFTLVWGTQSHVFPRGCTVIAHENALEVFVLVGRQP
jgi:hypothetical protein